MIPLIWKPRYVENKKPPEFCESKTIDKVKEILKSNPLTCCLKEQIVKSKIQSKSFNFV